MSIDADSLRTFSEVAAGLIGFAGVSIGIGASRGSKLAMFDKIRFYNIMTAGLGVIILSHVPTVLSRLMMTGADIWFYSTLVYVVVLPFFGLIAIWPLITWKPTLKEKVAFFKNVEVWRWANNAFMLLILLAIIQNLTSWPFTSNQSTFEILIFVGLFQICFNFAHLVVAPVTPGDPSDVKE